MAVEMTPTERRDVARMTARWKDRLRAAIPDVTEAEMQQIVRLVVESRGRVQSGTLLSTMRSFDSYKARYPAAQHMFESGQIANEGQYRAQEIAYKRVMADYLGDAAAALSTPDKLAELMMGDTSPVEVRDRLILADNLLQSAPTEYKNALRELYGIEDNYQLAFLVDPATTKPALDKVANETARAVTLATRAAQEGLNISAQDIRGLAAETKMSFGADTFAAASEEVATEMKRASLLAQQDRRLAAIEGQQYQDIEAVQATFGDVEATLASQRRAERERARFGGSSAIGSTSLSTQRNL